MNTTQLIIANLVIAFQVTHDKLPPDYWRNPLRCGVNCLYGYLQINGQNRSLEQVSLETKLGPRGASLHELARVANLMGVPSSITKLDLSDLSRIPLPAIVHMDVKGGHFRLLLQVKKDEVTTADMISGEIQTYPIDVFLETWSGFALISQSDSEFSSIADRILPYIFVIGGLIGWFTIARQPWIAE